MNTIVERAKQALAQAPGKWSFQIKNGYRVLIDDEPAFAVFRPHPSTGRKQKYLLDETEFIAAAPDLMRELIKEVERLEAMLTERDSADTENLSTIRTLSEKGD